MEAFAAGGYHLQCVWIVSKSSEFVSSDESQATAIGGFYNAEKNARETVYRVLLPE